MQIKMEQRKVQKKSKGKNTFQIRDRTGKEQMKLIEETRIHIIEGLFDVWDTSIVTSLNCSATIQTYVGLLKKETDEWKNEKN